MTYYVFYAADMVNRSARCLAWCRTGVGPGFTEVTFTDLSGVQVIDAPDRWQLDGFLATVRATAPPADEETTF